MRVRYTHRARGDIEAIYADLDEHNPTAAQAIKDWLVKNIRGRILGSGVC